MVPAALHAANPDAARRPIPPYFDRGDRQRRPSCAVIDGATFDDFAGFAGEFSKLLCHHTWRGNLDACNDILRGGFGTPENGWVLKWLNCDSSRAALGYGATIKWLEDVLLTCHPSNRSHLEDRLLAAQRSEGARCST